MSEPSRPVLGTVYLVGAGPGDPGLATRRAAELIAAADVLVYDALANPALLELRPARAELLYVGKRAGQPSRNQGEINQLLVELAGRFRSVVRLKGGDPFVFGRGGEEALALVEAGVPFEVVPGVTAGVAAAAYAGIPVTHRGICTGVTLVTGHEDPEKDESQLDWTALAQGNNTLVFYMGVGRMADNFRRLMDGGLAASTPAAAVEWGTYPRQRVVAGTVATLPDQVARAGLGAPAITLVGGVVELRERLAWLERRPLWGRRVVVTRARAQASGLLRELAARGAEPIEFPTIRIESPPDPEPLRQAAREVGDFDWVVFTSANGVHRFWKALAAVGRDTRALGRVRVCAIGPATGEALEARGVRPDLLPAAYIAEGVLEAFRGIASLPGSRVLLPRAAGSRAVLPEGLTALGAQVVEVEAYRAVPDQAGAAALSDRFAANEIDLVTFTSSSTVRNFVAALGTRIGRARVASIGPVTSATARELGLTVDVEATEYTIPGLLRAVEASLAVDPG